MPNRKVSIYQRRGEDMIALFHPAHSDVLTFHEIDSGEVGEDQLQMYERTGAEIAPDYREVIRKLLGVLIPALDQCQPSERRMLD